MKYPVRFGQYYNCFSLINPAATGAEEKAEVSVEDQNLLGDFSKVSTFYLNASIRISPNNLRMNSSFSALGVMLYNEREGKYLNRSRVYLMYAWHGYLTRTLKIAGGLQLGVMNYNVKGTPLSGDGSDIAPDGIAGLWLYSKKFHLGASYNQLFKSKLQPLNEITILQPYFNFDGSYKLDLPANFCLIPSFSMRLSPEKKGTRIDFTTQLCYKDKIALATGIHDNFRMIHSVEIRNLLNENYPLSLCFTYGYPVVAREISTNFIEIGLRYSRN
jgi:type IX secretion system PorP/SprF family membrane protein